MPDNETNPPQNPPPARRPAPARPTEILQEAGPEPHYPGKK